MEPQRWKEGAMKVSHRTGEHSRAHVFWVGGTYPTCKLPSSSTRMTSSSVTWRGCMHIRLGFRDAIDILLLSSMKQANFFQSRNALSPGQKGYWLSQFSGPGNRYAPVKREHGDGWESRLGLFYMMVGCDNSPVRKPRFLKKPNVKALGDLVSRWVVTCLWVDIWSFFFFFFCMRSRGTGLVPQRGPRFLSDVVKVTRERFQA